MKKNIWFVIPARKGSKGLPFKNRKLFNHTADKIPENMVRKVIVTSDDKKVLEMADQRGFIAHDRKASLAHDKTSTREVLKDVSNSFSMKSDDIIVLLYLTYPSREWSDVEDAINLFCNKKASSLLCRKEIKSTPYLMMFEEEEMRGTKVIEHDLCRRQDYRKCFEMSHYVGVFLVDSLDHIDTNLWCSSTIFMQVSEKIDVDYKEDLETFYKEVEL